MKVKKQPGWMLSVNNKILVLRECCFLVTTPSGVNGRPSWNELLWFPLQSQVFHYKFFWSIIGLNRKIFITVELRLKLGGSE